MLFDGDFHWNSVIGEDIHKMEVIDNKNKNNHDGLNCPKLNGFGDKKTWTSMAWSPTYKGVTCGGVYRSDIFNCTQDCEFISGELFHDLYSLRWLQRNNEDMMI